jgi:hypothetical protein
MTIGPIRPPHSDTEMAEQEVLELLLHTSPALLSVDEVSARRPRTAPTSSATPRDRYRNAGP